MFLAALVILTLSLAKSMRACIRVKSQSKHAVHPVTVKAAVRAKDRSVMEIHFALALMMTSKTLTALRTKDSLLRPFL